MLKHIKPEHVRLGMFIESVDGDWNGQRFWKSRFLLDCPKDVEALGSSDAADIVINTDEGADVVLSPPGEIAAPVVPPNWRGPSRRSNTRSPSLRQSSKMREWVRAYLWATLCMLSTKLQRA